MLLILCAAVLFGGGLYLILASILTLPTLRYSRRLMNVAKAGRGKEVKSLESLLIAWASGLARFYKMDEYKKKKLTAQLYAAGIELTPETYVLKSWLAATLFAVLSVPAFFIFPLIAPAFWVLAIFVYFKESRLAQALVEKKKNAIEGELPRLVGYIAQELDQKTGVVYILEGYMGNAGVSMKEELAITVSDMKTGSHELALKRLDMRVGSAMLNEVVQGLLLVVAGNDERRFFLSLQDQFLKYQKQQLLKEVMKRPGKMRKFSALILLVFILTYFVVLGLAMAQSLVGIF